MSVKVTIEMEMKMWEKVEMPNRVKDANTGDWKADGTTVEKTRYYLRDEFGDMLPFLADNSYRDLEGSNCEVTLEIEYNDYQNKNVVKLSNITQLQ